MGFGTLYSFVEDFALPLSKEFAQMNILRSKGGGRRERVVIVSLFFLS